MLSLNEFNLKRLRFWLFSLLITFSFSKASISDESIPKVIVQLSAKKISIDNNNLLAISFKNEPHWHTYWKNPGDAGLPIKVSDIDTGEQIESLEWPTPKRYIEPGDAWAYGYESEYTLFFKLPEKKRLNLNATWLVCKHICIPGKAEIKFNDVDQVSGEITPRSMQLASLNDNTLEERYFGLPKKDPNYLKELDLILVKNSKQEDSLILYYNLNKPTGNYLTKFQNLLFPFPNPLLDFKHEELFIDNDGHLYAKMLIEWNGYYLEPEVPFPKSLEFSNTINLDFIYSSQEKSNSKLISKTFKTLSSNSDQIEKFYSLLSPVSFDKDAKRESTLKNESRENSKNTQSIFSFILLAFLGGLVLNLMPCVLPVITLKLFSLTSISTESKSKISSHNLFYSLGVITTFWILATVISLMKLSGGIVGWGFQLQSPIFILVMSTGLFIFSLNMFGLFEFITPGGKSLGDIKTKGKSGDFLNGVLATVLSTPCSAPFLGTALAFAFTQGTGIIFLIFTFIGVGLAFPFILTIFFPGLIKFFPKPGNWMNTLKSFLGLSLLCTSIWLLSLLSTLTNSDFITWVLVAFSFFFYGIYLYKKSSYKKSSLILFTILGLLVMGLNYNPRNISAKKLVTADIGLTKKAGLSWETWSEEKLANYQNKKILTFIDFTADWCLTCKVNEKLIISSDAFKKLINDNQISLLLGDWTNGDEKITKWLLKNDMAGVPAYFFVDRNGELHNLGETISVKKIKDLL